MRRLLPPVAIVAVLLLALGAGVAVSSGDERAPSSTATAPASKSPTRDRDRGAGHGGLRGGLFRAVKGQVLASTAGRLGVTVPELRNALRTTHRQARERYFAVAGLTDQERAALESCHGAGFGHHRHDRHDRRDRSQRRGAACDTATARSAVAKLRASRKDLDLTAEKQQIAADLGTALGVAPEKVLEAVRAELVERLGQAVGFGLVTAKGQELSLACFDAPASCDFGALRAEVRHPLGGGRHARRGHR